LKSSHHRRTADTDAEGQQQHQRNYADLGGD
jgi:hypothetical protein